MLDPDILTNILQSYTPAAPGVVSSAGADQRQERKQKCRLKTVFPVLGRGEIPTPKPRETRRSHLRAGQWCCCPGQGSRVGWGKTSLCCLCRAVAMWQPWEPGAVRQTPVWGWGYWDKVPALCRVWWGLCQHLGGTEPPHSQGKHIPVSAVMGSAGRLIFWEWDDLVQIWVYVGAVCPPLPACFHQGQCFSFPFCSFIVSGSERKGKGDYLQF